ncbi:magnesium transporter MRS2-1-like protein, partial [Trifolium pratense]
RYHVCRANIMDVYLYIQVRVEIKQLMDDDGDMAEISVTPVSTPPDFRRLDKSLSIARSVHKRMRSSERNAENIEELEMLLETYFVVIDSAL